MKRLEPGTFQVTHYAGPDAPACCRMKVTVRPEEASHDRRREDLEADPHGEVAALHRAYLAIEKHHGRGC